MNKAEFEKLTISFASLNEKFNEIKACCPTSDCKCSCDCEKRIVSVCDSISYMISNLHDRITYISESLWEHKKGHLPAIKTASQMESALSALGLEGDYEVEKPSIYIQASLKSGPTLTLNYKKS